MQIDNLCNGMEKQLMINILFWNIGTTKQNVDDSDRNHRMDAVIEELIIENNIDIAVFCEYRLNLENICNALSVEYEEFKVAQLPSDCRVRMIYKEEYYLNLMRDSKYYFISSFENPLQKFLLSGVHFPSNLHASNRDAEMVVGQYIRDLKEAQVDIGHNKSIVVGDFNANPFDEVMLLTNFFNAIPYADIVENKKERRVYGKDYQMFYNPMWNLLGDRNVINSTYFYDSGGAIDFYRNIYDQVIISADMIAYYDKSALRIITETETQNLVDEDIKPNKREFSDHLPIVFSIKEG